MYKLVDSFEFVFLIESVIVFVYLSSFVFVQCSKKMQNIPIGRRSVDNLSADRSSDLIFSAPIVCIRTCIRKCIRTCIRICIRIQNMYVYCQLDVVRSYTLHHLCRWYSAIKYIYNIYYTYHNKYKHKHRNFVWWKTPKTLPWIIKMSSREW